MDKINNEKTEIINEICTVSNHIMDLIDQISENAEADASSLVNSMLDEYEKRTLLIDELEKMIRGG
jgi:hypothetical protein